MATAVTTARTSPPARSVARAGVFTVAATVSALLVNPATGIPNARVLGQSGRGALTAVLAVPPIVAWVFEMGCVAAVTYHQARRPEDGPRLVGTWLAGRYAVVKSLYATIAIAVAATIAALAGVAVPLVYGADFSGSVTPLRILLVGTLLYAAAGVACSGLYAVNRPFTAALAQFTAAVFTVAGLLLFLRSGGIEAEAIVSTVAYSLVFVITVLLYRRTAGLTWREPAPPVMTTWFRQATRGALGRA